MALPQKYESHLDRVSTGSGSDLIKPRESKIVRKYRMLITDQVATAPCTDPIQVRLVLLRQSPARALLREEKIKCKQQPELENMNDCSRGARLSRPYPQQWFIPAKQRLWKAQ